MPNPQVNPKDAALRFAFFSALNFTKPVKLQAAIGRLSSIVKAKFELFRRHFKCQDFESRKVAVVLKMKLVGMHLCGGGTTRRVLRWFYSYFLVSM